LIQISRNHEDFILDPLALEDISPLGRIFAAPSIEKVLHAAENDLIGFKRDFQFQMQNVFDTSVASRLLGRSKLGLARILAEEFGVKLDKKYQRCNWEKRPLSSEQLYYAQLDTHFLIDLRNRLHGELLKKNLWSQAQKEYLRLEKIRLNPPRRWDPDGYLRLKGAQKLSEPSLRVLKELSAYRERLARSVNKAPFRVMNNEFMVRVAREMPRDVASLLRVRGLPSRFKGKGVARLWRVIKRGKS
ncbi:MAG: hypothetical protein HKM90_00680, partial [Desulfobacteraceae bacterium]|nr:hypothetical protein [Desulfobacteraceae bacterium]